MFTLLQICTALLTAVVMLTLASESFAYGLSRMIEAGFDYVEIKLALHSKRRVARLSAASEMEAMTRATRIEVSY